MATITIMMDSSAAHHRSGGHYRRLVLLSLLWLSGGGFAVVSALSFFCSGPTYYRRGRHDGTTFRLSPLILSSSSITAADDDNGGGASFPAAKTNDDDSEEEQLVVVHDHIYEYLGVRPPLIVPTRNRLGKKLARLTWHLRTPVLRILHAADPLKPNDSCINLECLWWKALSTTDPRSPACEQRDGDDGCGPTYDMLPAASRRLVVGLRKLHPRFIHAALEARTVYLDRAVAAEIHHFRNSNSNNNNNNTASNKNVRMITLGAGYDMRSVRFLSSHLVDEAHEFDVPETVHSKKRLFQERLLKRRPNRTTANDLPILIGLDLNNVDPFRNHLQQILLLHDNNNGGDWHTIFVVEGVLMYLKKGVASQILAACANAAKSSSLSSASLCFADRLDSASNNNATNAAALLQAEEIQAELSKTGWRLTDWAPNPAAHAKHMGTARLVCALL